MEHQRLLRLLRHLLPALCLASAACSAAEPPPPAVREWTAMGTRIRLSVRGDGAGTAADAMAEAARAALEAVESETSVFRAESAVSRLAAAAGTGGWIPTGPAFGEALDAALAVAEATGGAFNPLVGPLLEKHGFVRRPPGEPAAAGGEVPPEVLDWHRIERRPGECRLPLAGMRLDLGGVAKGVGADRAAAAIRAVAANDFLLDAGGTLVCRGTWTAGLRDPRKGPDAPPLQAFSLAGGMACATSGNYERPGHLMDPRTGRPVDGNGVLQATALARTAAEADAWSTALFVLGPDAGRAALASSAASVAAAWVVATGDGGMAVIHAPASR